MFAVLFSLSQRGGQTVDRLALAMGLFLCGVAANFAMSATGYYPARAMTGSLLLMVSASGLLLPGLRLTRADALLRGLEWALCLFALLLCIQAAPQTYDRYRESEARVQRVTAARDAAQLSVSDTNISGKTKFDVFFDMIDLTDNPEYFSNTVFARYYGLTSIVAEVYR